MTTRNPGEIICEEVFITTDNDKGKVYKPNGNTLLFDPPIKFLNKHAWAVKNTVTGDKYAALFNPIDASKTTEHFKRIMEGKLHGINIEGKTTSLAIIGNQDGIECMALVII